MVPLILPTLDYFPHILVSEADGGKNINNMNAS